MYIGRQHGTQKSHQDHRPACSINGDFSKTECIDVGSVYCSEGARIPVVKVYLSETEPIDVCCRYIADHIDDS